MAKQLTLDGDETFEGVCCEACWFAEEEKCVCRCGGVNHGKGLHESEEKEEE